MGSRYRFLRSPRTLAFTGLCLSILFALVGCGQANKSASESAADAASIESEGGSAYSTSPAESSEALASEPPELAERAYTSFDDGSEELAIGAGGDSLAIPSLNGPRPLAPSGSGKRSNPDSFPASPAKKSNASQSRMPLSMDSSGTATNSSQDSPTNMAQTVPAQTAQVDEQIANSYALGKKVDVYFATDRLPTKELLPGAVRTFTPAVVVALLCVLVFIGMVAAKRMQALWLLGSGLGLCLSIVVLHVSIVRWQEYQRLASNASTRFSTARYETTDDYPLNVGIATVSLPEKHEPGKIEAPSLFRLEFVESPDKHVMLRSLEVEHNVEEWFARINDEIRYMEERAGFVFIHGYNVKFGDALKRTAQLATDLGVDGPAICFSWPSRGQLAAYTADESTVSWSAPHFEQLLIDLRSKAGCNRINIVAHSMGNRALLEAIERLHLRMKYASTPPEKLVENLILAAPDVDVSQFSHRYQKPIAAIARHSTIYFSNGDRALQASAGVHQASRVGFAADNLALVEGIEAIHVGSQPVLGLGHSYYGSDLAVIDDMRILFRTSSPASARPFLTSKTGPRGNTYWEINRQLHAKHKSQDLR